MDEEQQSHIISEQVFGSSKKIQFVSVSPMDSLLSAVNHAHRIHLPHPSSSPLRNAKDYHGGSQRTMSIESLLHSNGQDMPTFENTTSSSKRRWHSSSIADSIDERSTKMRRRKDDTAAATTTTAIQQQQQQQRQQQHCQLSSNGGSGLRTENHQQHMTTITCLHAAVAQKSYGSEKRFLCPPPMVSIQHHQQGANNNTDAPTPVVSMAVVSENGDRPLEQKILLDENKQGSFKYLHVTGTAKAKQFYLRVSLSHNHYHSFTPSSPSPSSSSASSSNSKSSTPPLPPASPSSTTTTSVPAQPYVTFFSYPVSIISKPSKKTAKARNVSNCIVANSQISLFNRINSQTVRTKYMTIQDNKLCAKNSTWSPFDIVVLRQPVQTNVGVSDESSLAAAAAAHHHHHHHQSSTSSSSPGPGSSNSSSIPVTYGSEIMLKDSRTGFRSPPMIIRKVDKGRISLSACGPVSQMQKIALQLASTATENSDEKPLYLSASGKTMTLQQQQRSSSSSDEQQKQQQQQSSDDDNGLCNTTATWLDFAPSKLSVEKSGQDRVECVDDFLCWTIVGIAKFEYSYIEPIVETNSPPMSHQQYQTQQQSSSSLLSMVSSLSSYESAAADRVTYHHHHRHQPSPPPSPPRRIVPLPMILSVDYLPQTHSVEILGKHLLQPTTVPARLFDFYLGSHGPLTIKDHHQVPLDDDVRLTLELPPAQDLLVANHDVLVTKHDGSRYLELPLVMKRHDGTVYGTGKALACDVLVNCDAGRWSVVPHVNSP